ncbi:MAG: hypothetical protein KIT09_32460 [Bryobacteraceae bacterium]|nr:hypothetical protein [Bryobacteraceae bacterium]
MGRRTLLLLLCAFGSAKGETPPRPAKGKLGRSPDGKPLLETKDGRSILLEGDVDTLSVLDDERLAGVELEVFGKSLGPDRFEVGPIYRKSMLVLRDGKRLTISYWCDLCSIRNYTPGKCQCCQEETALDLREE